MLGILCFLSMSRLAFDHKFFDEGFASSSSTRIFLIHIHCIHEPHPHLALFPGPRAFAVLLLRRVP
jgi:hypothetical protein